MLNFDVEINDLEFGAFWEKRIVLDLSNGCMNGVYEGTRDAMKDAKASHLYKDQTGNLTRSGSVQMLSVDSMGAEGLMVWAAPYANFVEEDTRPHTIEARKAKMLRWFVGGVARFARSVQHPGTKGQPFAGPALQKAERIVLKMIEVGISIAQKELDQ